MDEDLKQLEAELMALQPAAPRRALVTRLEAELAPASGATTPAAADNIVRHPARQWWAGAAAGLSIAAAIAVAAFFISRRAAAPATPLTPVQVAVTPAAVAPAPADPATPGKWVVQEITPAEAALFKPVASENVLYAVKDEGLVTLDDGTAARRERLNYVDTIIWKNPRTNASVKWTVPREEIRVVPVKFQ